MHVCWDCRAFALPVIEQWRDCRDVSCGFLWKWSACRKVPLIPRRTRVIGRKEACRSEAIVHRLEVGGADQDVVARIKGIETETMVNAQFDPGPRHDLHQPACSPG